jgi:SAM-dependent methyltransferase
LAPGARVLDVGCGTGATVNHLRSLCGLRAMGIDPSPALLEKAARCHSGLPLLQGRAEQLPVGDESLEGVFCECVLSLCFDIQATLQEIRRVLQPGGYLVVTDIYSRDRTAPVQMAGEPSATGCLQGAHGRTALQTCFVAAGFDLLVWEDHSALLKQLAGQLIWRYGSLEAFWSAAPGTDAASVNTRDGAGGCRRPGYYLSVAQNPVGD